MLQDQTPAIVPTQAQALPVKASPPGLPQLTEPRSMRELLEMANTLVASQFLPQGVATAQQAVAIMLTGRELGMGMMQSLRSIDVIYQTPCIKPKALLARAYQVVPGFIHQFVERSEKRCRIRMTRAEWQGLPPLKDADGMDLPSGWIEFCFEMADAAKMQTKEKGQTIPLTKKYNWVTMPKAMLVWRAVGAMLRENCPDVEGVGLYSPEEFGARVDPEGEIVPGPDGRPIIDAEPIDLQNPADLPDNPTMPELVANIKGRLEAVGVLYERFCAWLLESGEIEVDPKKGRPSLALLKPDAARGTTVQRLAHMIRPDVWIATLTAYAAWETNDDLKTKLIEGLGLGAKPAIVDEPEPEPAPEPEPEHKVKPKPKPKPKPPKTPPTPPEPEAEPKGAEPPEDAGGVIPGSETAVSDPMEVLRNAVVALGQMPDAKRSALLKRATADPAAVDKDWGQAVTDMQKVNPLGFAALLTWLKD